MTEQDAYLHGFIYESFIRRAFKCDIGQHGASVGVLKFLLLADMGMGSNYSIDPYEKQLGEAKTFLIKAIDKFLKRKPTQAEQLFLEKMKELVRNATIATDLVTTIKVGLQNTERFT